MNRFYHDAASKTYVNTKNTGEPVLEDHDRGLVYEAQEEILTSQRGSLITKTAWIAQKTHNIIPKGARSPLSGDPSAITSVTNRFIFIKLP